MDGNYGTTQFQDKIAALRQSLDALAKKGDTMTWREVNAQLDGLQKVSQTMQDLPPEPKLLKGAIASLRKENANLRKAEKFVAQMDQFQQRLGTLQQENKRLQEQLTLLQQDRTDAIAASRSQIAKVKTEEHRKIVADNTTKEMDKLGDERVADLDGNFGDDNDILLVGQELISDERSVNDSGVLSTPAPASALNHLRPQAQPKLTTKDDTQFMLPTNDKEKTPKSVEKAAKNPSLANNLAALKDVDKTGVLSLPPEKSSAKAPNRTTLLPIIEPTAKKETAKQPNDALETLSEAEVLKILQLEKSQLDELLKTGKLPATANKEGQKRFYRKEVEILRQQAMESDTAIMSDDKNKKMIGRLKQLYRNIEQEPPQT